MHVWQRARTLKNYFFCLRIKFMYILFCPINLLLWSQNGTLCPKSVPFCDQIIGMKKKLVKDFFHRQNVMSITYMPHAKPSPFPIEKKYSQIQYHLPPPEIMFKMNYVCFMENQNEYYG